MYDSDRASNGENTPTSCLDFLSLVSLLTICVPADQSGSSSEDSESEDPPDKKLSPWRGRSEAPPCQEEDEEEVKQQQQQEEEEVAEDIEAADVTKNTNDNTADTTTASQMPTATAPPCPSMPQEKADKVLSQSEKKEAEQGEEPAGEAAMLPVQLDKENKMSPEQVTSTGQEVLRRTSPSRMSPQADKTNKMSPATAADKHKMSPEKSMSSPQADPTDEDRSAPLSSPRVKGRRSIFREAGSETPTRILLCSPAPAPSPSHMAALSSPPRSVLKRQDEPMVVLHCLPSQRIPPESPADSDTDSATEEEEEEEAGLPEERSSLVLKRKAVEQRAGDKKLRPDRKEEVAALKTLPPKMATDVSPVRRVESERRSEGVLKAEEWPLPAEAMQREVSEERLTGVAAKEPEVLAGTTPTTVEAPGPAPTEEAEPQIGPEALVCHEVDLDDPDDKEKPSPTTSPEHLLLMMREQQPAPPPLPNLLHTPLPSPHLPQPQVRPFLPAATPSSAPCLEELHPARSTAEEERGATRGEQEGDSSPGFDGSASSSTSTSLLSLQDNKDRGEYRVRVAKIS